MANKKEELFQPSKMQTIQHSDVGDMKKLLEKKQEDSEDEIVPIEDIFASLKDRKIHSIIQGGAAYYWPAMKDAAVHGIIKDRFPVPTKYGTAFLYSIELLEVATAVDVISGELALIEKGERMHVLERTVLKPLVNHIGEEVAIVCDGKRPSKRTPGQSYWSYRAAVIDQIEE